MFVRQYFAAFHDIVEIVGHTQAFDCTSVPNRSVRILSGHYIPAPKAACRSMDCHRKYEVDFHINRSH